MENTLKHNIRLYFPYTFNANANSVDYLSCIKKVNDLKIHSLIYSAPFLKHNIIDKYLDKSIWEKGFCKLDKSIHRYGNKLLNGVEIKNNNTGFFGFQPIKMTSPAIRVLNQGSHNKLGEGIKLKIKPAAIKRLEEKNIYPPHKTGNWPLMFNDVWFYGFSMGIGMVVVDLSIKQPSKNGIQINKLEELQEIIYIICRNANNNQSAELTWNDEKQSKSQGLSSLISAILPESTGSQIQLKATTDPGNTYAYTTISSNQKLTYEERKTLIFRIARKYSNNYLPVNISEHIQYFEPFKPITHAFSLEGAVSYIDFDCYGQNIPESIVNFDKSAVKLAYAPLVLLTYAEYIYLRETESNTTDEEMVDMKNPSSKSLESLRTLRSSLYDFRLNFRYAQISGNTNHNLFCNYNKKALESDKILKEISSDMQEIEQYISDQVSLKHEMRLKKYGILGSIFAVIIGWVEIWGLNLHDILFGDSLIPKKSIFIFISVLILLNLIIYLVNKSPPQDTKDE